MFFPRKNAKYMKWWTYQPYLNKAERMKDTDKALWVIQRTLDFCILFNSKYEIRKHEWHWWAERLDLWQLELAVCVFRPAGGMARFGIGFLVEILSSLEWIVNNHKWKLPFILNALYLLLGQIVVDSFLPLKKPFYKANLFQVRKQLHFCSSLCVVSFII